MNLQCNSFEMIASMMCTRCYLRSDFDTLQQQEESQSQYLIELAQVGNYRHTLCVYTMNTNASD